MQHIRNNKQCGVKKKWFIFKKGKMKNAIICGILFMHTKKTFFLQIFICWIDMLDIWRYKIYKLHILENIFKQNVMVPTLPNFIFVPLNFIIPFELCELRWGEMELKFKKLKLKYISVFCLVGNYFSFLLIRSNFLFWVLSISRQPLMLF